MSTRAEQTWDLVLNAALKVPLVQVDREAFLRRELAPHLSATALSTALERSPAAAGIDPKVVDRISASVIRTHTLAVAGLSGLAALPPFPLAAATIPADLTQFFAQTLMVAQKLAYLRGWSSMTNSSGEFDDDSRYQLTLFVAAMLGSEVATVAVREVAAHVVQQVAGSLPRIALTQVVGYGALAEAAKWLGVKLAKDLFARAAARVIPFVSAILASSISGYTFHAMATRLNEELKRLPPNQFVNESKAASESP